MVGRQGRELYFFSWFDSKRTYASGCLGECQMQLMGNRIGTGSERNRQRGLNE